jgi:FkbH-like protein
MHEEVPPPDTAPRPRTPVRTLLIGGCVVQFAAGELIEAGRHRGLAITAVHEWPAVRGRLHDLVGRHQPDLVVLQPTVLPFLTGLWDEVVFLAPDERRRRLEVMKRALAGAIGELADAAGGRCALVHNIASPAVSPFGRLDFRQETGHAAIVAELNRHVADQVRGHRSLLVVDEERLAVRHGAAALFDDLLFPYGHHGGRPDPAVEAPHELPALGRALATEYVAGYLVHQGRDRIKLVVVDLDDTLWPGIAADDGFGWAQADTTSRWIRLGLHQALRILKHRGVLLATASKGTERATLDAWAAMPAGQWLTPDDFVAHRINWAAKSANLADLCDRLGVAPSAVLFLDDNPVERAEVRRRLPGVVVPELAVHEFREFLLTEPGLGGGAVTEEARRRTETTRAMLRRTEAVTAVGDDFLAELGVTARIWRAGPNDLHRAAELFNRTNQFTTTAWRTTEAELAGLLAHRHRLHLMAVSDRFADYGTVGACLIDDDAVVAFAISCRVIGLDVAPGFLACCVRDHHAPAAVIGRIVATDRNHAARDLYTRAGFTDRGDGTYALRSVAALLAPDHLPQRFTIHQEIAR